MNVLWTNAFYMNALDVAFVASVCWLLLRFSNTGRRDGRLPTGPPTLPIIGNLHLFPKRLLHLKFTEWAKLYGGIYSIKLGPNTAIVLTSPRLVRELLDKRNASSPDRPSNHIADVITGGMNIALSKYDAYWKPLRRTAHQILTRKACERHMPIQRMEATQLMHDLLTRPEKFYTHIRRYSTSVITSMMFGTRCPTYETPVLTEFYHMMEKWQLALEPGAHPPVDLIPILRYIPERWASWKTLCREVRSLQRKLYFGLLDQCETRVLKGNRNGCCMEEILDNNKRYSMHRELSGYLGGALLEGGSETTSLFLQGLIQALVVYPDVQRKAHEEIDRVIGWERAPNFDDIQYLPYVQAIVKETHRFRPVAPLGLPHVLLADEKINDYVIPKGTIIFMNIWGMFRDEAVYHEPEVFNPDRFLTSEYGTKADVDDFGRRHDLAFGSGRRICPGILFAQNSIFLNTMNLLWGFDFTEAVDPSTNTPIKFDLNHTIKGLLSGPSPFSCSIRARSAAHAELIESTFQATKKEFLPYETECLQVDPSN